RSAGGTGRARPPATEARASARPGTESPEHLPDPEGQVRTRRRSRTGRVTQGDPDPPHPPARGISRTGDQPPGPGTEIRGTIPDRPGLPKPADRGRVRRVLAQHG